MRTIKMLITILVVMFITQIPLGASAQEQKDSKLVQDDLKVNFNGKFVVRFREDQTNYYYLVDFTQLPSRFEKVYLMNLIFKSNQIVNTDGDISHDYISFLVNKKFSEEETIKIFTDNKNSTTETARTMSEAEKSEWLKKNDKYK